MHHKRTITILIVGALAVTLAVGAVAYHTVLAATPTTTSAISPNISSTLTMYWFGGNGMNGGYTSEELAKALGITVDALNTAYQNAYSSALKQAVSDGLITQAQADQLTANGSAFPFGNRWDGWLTQNGIDFNSYLAQSLGISVEKLTSAYQTAYNANIDQMVTAGTLTQAQADLMKGEYALYTNSAFQSSMNSAFTAAVNAAVSSGVITQTQADQILSQGSNMFSRGPLEFGGRGGSHGRGGMPPDAGNIPQVTP